MVLMAAATACAPCCPAVFWGCWGGLLWICILPNVLNLAFYIWTSDAAYLRTQAGRLWQKITHR